MALQGGPDGGGGGVDDLDVIAAGAGEEGAVGGDRDGAAGVELLDRVGHAVAFLEGEGRHSEGVASPAGWCCCCCWCC